MVRTDETGKIIESEQDAQRRIEKTARSMAAQTEVELQQKAAINGAKYNFESVPDKKKAAYTQMSEEQLHQAISDLNGKISTATSNGLKKRSRYEIGYINSLLGQKAQATTMEEFRAVPEMRWEDAPLHPEAQSANKLDPAAQYEKDALLYVTDKQLSAYKQMNANELSNAYQKLYDEWARFTEIYEAEAATSNVSISLSRRKYQEQLEGEAELVGYLLQQKQAEAAAEQQEISPVVEGLEFPAGEDVSQVFRDMREHVKGTNASTDWTQRLRELGEKHGGTRQTILGEEGVKILQERIARLESEIAATSKQIEAIKTNSKQADAINSMIAKL